MLRMQNSCSCAFRGDSCRKTAAGESRGLAHDRQGTMICERWKAKLGCSNAGLLDRQRQIPIALSKRRMGSSQCLSLHQYCSLRALQQTVPMLFGLGDFPI